MISRKFKQIQKDNPNLSTLICYIRTIKEMRLHNDVIEKNLRLVDFEDYKGSSRKELLAYLYTV